MANRLAVLPTCLLSKTLLLKAATSINIMGNRLVIEAFGITGNTEFFFSIQVNAAFGA